MLKTARLLILLPTLCLSVPSFTQTTRSPDGYMLFPGRQAVLENVPSTEFTPPPASAIGTIAGRQALMIDAPCESCEMGKAVVIDSKDNVWFLVTREDKVVRLDPKTRNMTVFTMPAGSGPYSMGIDAQDIIWITAHGIEMLLEFDPQKRTVVAYPPPTKGFMVHLGVDDRNGLVYFSQPGANQVVRFSRAGGFREYPIPTPNSGPARISVDEKGVVWFPLLYANKLARLDPSTGNIREWALPTPDGLPSYVRHSKDGSVWLSQPMADRIVRFDGEKFREYKIPTKQSIVSMQVEDADGKVWFTEGGWRGSAGGNKIGWLDPASGEVVELSVPLENAQPSGIARTRDDTIWLQLSARGKIIYLPKASSK